MAEFGPRRRFHNNLTSFWELSTRSGSIASRPSFAEYSPEMVTGSQKQISDGAQVASSSPSKTDRGVLYGVFAFLSKIARGEPLDALTEASNPANTIRMIDQWDNLDGTIERGYAGPSIFFENGQRSRRPLARRAIRSPARFCRYQHLRHQQCERESPAPGRIFLFRSSRRIAEAFRPWGVRLAISVDVSSPQKIGGLDTFDPLDPHVAAWWQQTVDALYETIPDFAGFVVKADSEGRAGPAQLRPHSRRRRKRDRPRAATARRPALLSQFRVRPPSRLAQSEERSRQEPLTTSSIRSTAKFADNVVIQIKHGPIDFQVREPVSPLLGGLEKTNEAIELQITQEYTGPAAPSLLPRADVERSPRLRHAQRQSSRLSCAIWSPGKSIAGRPAVSSASLTSAWMRTGLAHPLAMANLYGFGRLAWNPTLARQRRSPKNGPG